MNICVTEFERCRRSKILFKHSKLEYIGLTSLEIYIYTAVVITPGTCLMYHGAVILKISFKRLPSEAWVLRSGYT